MADNSFKIKNSLVLTPVDLTTLTNPQAGDLACDINDSNKIKRYDANASSWTEVGSGGGVGNINALLTQTFDTATLAQFTQTGLALSTSNPIDGIQSARLIHQPATSQSFKQVIDVDRKYRGELMQLSMQVRSSASNGNLTLLVTDETNSATIAASQSISTGSQTIASLVTNATTTVSGFSNSVINGLSIGMTVTGSGIATGTLISAINTTALTITLSQAATASATVSLNFSALPDRRTFSFIIPANCASMSYTITALQEANAPESYIDDVVIELASTALLSTSVDVPNMTAWQGYTPTFQGFGTPTNIEFEWRQVGENVEIRGKFASGTSTAVEARVGLPAGLTSAGTGLIPSIQKIGSGNRQNTNGYSLGILIEPSVTYITIGIEALLNGLAKQNGNAITGTGEAISFFASVPCSGLSATSTKTIALTQSGLVQEADSNFEIGTPVGASTNTLIRTFSGIFSNSGDAVLYTKNATLGDSITILKDGVYNINYSEGFTTAGIGFAITKNYAINTAANSIPRANVLAFAFSEDAGSWVNQISFSGKLVTGDVIRFATGTNSTIGNAYQGVSISYQGSLKQVSVNPNSKITIPTSELRFEGSSSRGSTATAIVKFDTLAKIRGDAFTVTNTVADGTFVTMLKAGRLDIGTSVVLSSNGSLAITLNQSTLTAFPSSSQSLNSVDNLANSRAAVSWNGDVLVGDVIRISSTVALTSNPTNNLHLSFQEQDIAVSVTNTLPQFSESDSSVRVDGSNGYGTNVNNKVQRFSNVRTNLGSDITYLSSATEGDSFLINSDGIYNISFSNNFANASDLGIVLNATDLITGISTQPRSGVLNQSTTGATNWNTTAQWSGFLNKNSVIRAFNDGAAVAVAADAFFTISKVGKPNVTGVNVTPFVNVPQVEQQVILLSGGSASAAADITNFTVSKNTNNGIVSYSNGRITALKKCKVSTTLGITAGASGDFYPAIFKNGVNASSVAYTFAISGYAPSVSYEDILEAGEYLTYRPNNISGAGAKVSLTAEALSDQILTAPETFSTDTASLAYSSSYTLATLNTAPVGSYITFTYAANTNTRTQTTTRPTQTDADMNANGMLIYTRAYNAASTAAQPATIAIQIGKGHKGKTINLYKSAAKVNAGGTDLTVISSTTQQGLFYSDYNEVTGILVVDAGIAALTTITSNSFGFSDISTQTSGYLVINAAKNPVITGFGLNRIAARAVQTSAQSIPNNAITLVTWDASKTFDTNGALNTGSGTYTTPETGYYNVSAKVSYVAGLTAGNTIIVYIFKNGIQYSREFVISQGALAMPIIADLLFLAKGDTVDIRAYQNSGSARSLDTNDNVFSIVKTSV